METSCICRFCASPCKNPNSLRNHERLCKENPNRDLRSVENLAKGRKFYAEYQKSNGSWNRGLTKEIDERISRMALSLQGKPSVMKGKHYGRKFNNENGLSGGIREGAGRGKKGRYNGIWCDSSWELAYLIYCLEHEIRIERCKESFEYQFEGKTHKYFPDFIVEGTYVEIKGFDTAKVKAKIDQFPKDKPFRILHEADLSSVFSYVTQKYGEDFIRLYEH